MSPHTVTLLLVRTIKIWSICNTVLLTAVTTYCIRSPERIHAAYIRLHRLNTFLGIFMVSVKVKMWNQLPLSLVFASLVLLLLLLALICSVVSDSVQLYGLQAPLSMGFSRQEYWSGLLSSPPGDLPNPGIEPGSPALQADSWSLIHQGSPTCLAILFPIQHFFMIRITLSSYD